MASRERNTAPEVSDFYVPAVRKLASRKAGMLTRW